MRLADGVVVGEAGAYNPQIPRGADVISRIIAAEKGFLSDLAQSVRSAVWDLVRAAASQAEADPACIRGYVVAGNLTMMHLLVGADPSGIRRIPSEPRALAFDPVPAADLGWPGADAALVHIVPAAGGWVGGDIMSGVVRCGFSRATDTVTLYVDLGTNGEIAVGGRAFALTCACSAGPAFEGGGIRCGMRADRGAVDGARVDPETELLALSVIGGGPPRGLCGSGLITVTQALFSAGWIDRRAQFTDALPAAASDGRPVGCGGGPDAGPDPGVVGAGPRQSRAREGGHLCGHPLAGDGAGRGRRPDRAGRGLRQLRPLSQPAGGGRHRPRCRTCRSAVTATSRTVRSRARPWRCSRARSARRLTTTSGA